MNYRISARLVGLAIGALTAAAAVGGSAQQLAKAAPDGVVIDNFAFAPAILTVAPGTKVTWVNHDDEPHTVNSLNQKRPFKSPALDTDDKFSFVFDQPGTYKYFCSVHPHMTGTVVVK